MVRKVIDKPYGDNTLSNAAFFGMIRSALRQKSRWFKPVMICKERSKVAYTGINKRRKWSYKCEGCGKLKDGKEIAVHHKTECGSLNSFSDLPGFVERLFCDSKFLILLCDDCHKKEHKL